LREFEKTHGFSKFTLLGRFPVLYREMAARSAQRRYRKREARKAFLESACTEEPPPSGHTLAARLGTNRAHLKRVFPEIWQVVLRRHAEYRKQEALRKHAAFAE
jgi:hypothetical protein